jgi:predicted DNA-binding transcriptional regulator AlpA
MWYDGDMKNCPLVGIVEVANMLGVERHTVHTWINRGTLPRADWPTVNGSRAWERRNILQWAGESGRLRDDSLLGPEGAEALRVEYRETFKAEPVTVRNGGVADTYAPRKGDPPTRLERDMAEAMAEAGVE